MNKPLPTADSQKAFSRRDALKLGTAVTAFTIVPRHVLGGAGQTPPSERLNLAGIGAGGNMCRHNLAHFAERKQNIVALADPWDPSEWQGPAKDYHKKYYPDAKIYRDYRDLLDGEPGLDGVVVVTPDHWHAKITMDALRRGLATYTEKPLTRTISEARALKAAAREAGVATQMGNNGHAGDWIRKTCEYVWDDTLGPVQEVHAWTDRAGTYWPQGVGRPTTAAEVPAELDWDLWLGPAARRPYQEAYTRQKWRGWVDFGAGALGDMGCHILDPVYWSLKLGHPTSVEATTTVHPEAVRKETFPTAAVITYRYPAREEMPPVRIIFYTGGLRAPRPEIFPVDYKLPANGAILIGSKGSMLAEFGQQPVLFPKSLAEQNPTPKQVLARGPDHWTDWVDAARGTGVTCGSNFDYASGLTEMVLLGTIAARVAEPLEWDGENMRFLNNDAANGMVHHEYENGWTL